MLFDKRLRFYKIKPVKTKNVTKNLQAPLSDKKEKTVVIKE